VFTNYGNFEGFGTINLSNGSIVTNGGTGNLNMNQNTTIQSSGLGEIINQGVVNIQNAEINFGDFTITNNGGQVFFDHSNISCARFTQTSGSTTLQGGTIDVPLVVVQNGTISGTGVITGSLVNSGNVTAQNGSLTNITAYNYTQTSQGNTQVYVQGESISTQVSSQYCSLSGTVYVNVVQKPNVSATYSVYAWAIAADNNAPKVVFNPPSKCYRYQLKTNSLNILLDVNGCSGDSVPKGVIIGVTVGVVGVAAVLVILALKFTPLGRRILPYRHK